MAFTKTKDRTELYYDGRGQERPAVLIRGWPLDAGTWFIAP